MVPTNPHSHGVQVTNDGATILKSIGVDNPAAKVLVGELAFQVLCVYSIPTAPPPPPPPPQIYL